MKVVYLKDNIPVKDFIVMISLSDFVLTEHKDIIRELYIIGVKCITKISEKIDEKTYNSEIYMEGDNIVLKELNNIDNSSLNKLFHIEDEFDTLYVNDNKFQKSMQKEATKLSYSEKREKYKKQMRQSSCKN